MKKTIFQAPNGNPSMMRFLAFWSYVAGSIGSGVFALMLIVAFFLGKIEWASTFMACFMTCLGLMGGGIIMKGVQSGSENKPVVSDVAEPQPPPFMEGG